MTTIVTSDWSRAGNSSRFTPGDWTASNIDHYNSADASRQDSERIRNEAVRVLVYTEIFLCDVQIFLPARCVSSATARTKR